MADISRLLERYKQGESEKLLKSSVPANQRRSIIARLSILAQTAGQIERKQNLKHGLTKGDL